MARHGKSLMDIEAQRKRIAEQIRLRYVLGMMDYDTANRRMRQIEETAMRYKENIANQPRDKAHTRAMEKKLGDSFFRDDDDKAWEKFRMMAERNSTVKWSRDTYMTGRKTSKARI